MEATAGRQEPYTYGSLGPDDLVSCNGATKTVRAGDKDRGLQPGALNARGRRPPLLLQQRDRLRQVGSLFLIVVLIHDEAEPERQQADQKRSGNRTKYLSFTFFLVH